MERMRTSFQGLVNVIRFNWHFYALSLIFTLLVALAGTYYLRNELQSYSYVVCILVLGMSLVSLVVSHYVYDLSGLYQFNWLRQYVLKGTKLVNINAGFDEISDLLKDKFKITEFVALDFYDPLKHTEISIERARKAYPAFPHTLRVDTRNLPLVDESIETIVVFFAAHEIRNYSERIDFFKELGRVIKPTGRIIVTEHLRDLPNFLAYNIGFFHFYPGSSWHRVFRTAGLDVVREMKHTPFVSIYILTSHGDSL